MRRTKWRLAVVSLLAGAAVWYGCDNSTGPTGGVASYAFYFYDHGSQVNYAYYPESNVLDSFNLPLAIVEEVVSSDGRTLYATTSTGVYAVDLRTKHVELIWPGVAQVAVSRDGRYLALFDGDISVIRSTDNVVVYHDTDDVSWGKFSWDSKSVYAVHTGYAEGEGYVYSVQLPHGFPMMRKVSSVPDLYGVIPSRDGDRWYELAGFALSRQAVNLYDLRTGTYLADTVFRPGAGAITLTKDERYLIVSNPGPSSPYFPEDPGPSFSLAVLDATTLHLVQEIPIEGLFPGDLTETKVPVGEMAISADGRWLVGLSKWGWHYVAVNLEDFTVERLGILRDRYPRSLSTQLR